MTKEDLKQQEIKQAVIIADSFNQKLAPLTNLKPEVLLPVANGVVLDYMLKSLEACGIQETFIFCCANNHLVRSYINSSKWAEANSSMVVQVISSTCFLSMGDIMRELDSKALIRSDFILINGVVIATFPLAAILEDHKNCRQKDKNCAITLVCRKALPNHKDRCKENNFVVAVESASNRIRYFQRINKIKTIHFPLEIFQESDEINIHNDLLDSSISICSPCVPPLFSDNFDYQTLDDFVKGLLVNEELLGNSMYIHVSKAGYGACISNLYMYDAISQDIIGRWTYPIVPDMVWQPNGIKCSHTRHNIYKETNVGIGRNCQIQENVILGNGTIISENTTINDSIIGRNCVIGKNVKIQGSYLFDNVTVEDDCILDKCLLAERVILHSKVKVQPGCVLGSEVVIDKGITIPACTKLQSQIYTEDDSFGEDDFEEETKQVENKGYDVKLVGENGRGYLCHVTCDSDEEEDEKEVEDIWGKIEESEQEDEDDVSISSSTEIPSWDDDAGDETDGESAKYDEDITYFYKEVLESLQRAIEENVKSENLILEINSSKHAYNVTMKEVNTLVIKALLKIPVENHKETITAQQYLNIMKRNLTFLKPLVSNYVRSVESQNDCLTSIAEFMETYKYLISAVVKIMHYWYDQDILSEPVIVKWFDTLTVHQEFIKKSVSPFIQWLKTADEESDED